MRRILKIIVVSVVVVVGLFAASQLVRPARTNPPTDTRHAIQASANASKAFIAVLGRACNDCHSNETVWPWYSHVAPVSWVVVYDVREGRADLNFSEWGSYSIKEKGDKLEDICGRVQRDEMPDGKYTLVHRNARLTTDERNAVCTWSEQVRKRLDSSTPASALPQASLHHP